MLDLNAIADRLLTVSDSLDDIRLGEANAGERYLTALKEAETVLAQSLEEVRGEYRWHMPRRNAVKRKLRATVLLQAARTRGGGPFPEVSL